MKIGAALMLYEYGNMDRNYSDLTYTDECWLDFDVTCFDFWFRDRFYPDVFFAVEACGFHHLCHDR